MRGVRTQEKVLKESHMRLEELCKSFEAKGHNVSPSLLEPMSESGVKTRSESWFPSTLPKSVIDLYTWKGGQANDAWEEEFPFWFRDMSFISLDQAESEYKSMNGSYGIGNTLEEDGIVLRDSFPFAAFNGGWFVIPGSTHQWSSKYKEPVICVLQGITLFYYSLEHMLKTCIECVQHPEWSTEDPDLDEDIELQIWRKHNPGIFDDEF